MDNIKDTLLEYALYEYYSALAANLPAKGMAALLKDGTVLSAGPVHYASLKHISSAQEEFNAALAAHYYKDHKGPFPPLDDVLDALLVVEMDKKNPDDYIVGFHMEP
ncbi:MAG TPA: hypothetical protein PKI93_01230 [Alphaproteobacteria bacterium]|nr:hypothetical protein [Alphaproteobacteria bacterium]HNS44337.1 hypothetical protein [Alphaproteobacteria bacterium]